MDSWVRAIQGAPYKSRNYKKSDCFECLMSEPHLYPESERQEEKCLYDHLDSLSPTPSPQPSHPHLLLSQNHSASTQTEVVGIQSPGGRGHRRGRRGAEEVSVNRGHWSLQENKRYHWFLQIHYSHFVNRHMRRMDKIFKSMEMFVGTRQAEQCRSHHQKMEKKYLNFTTIISNLRRLHYNTTDIDPVLEEINAFGAHAMDGVATIEFLKQQQAIDPPELKERRKSVYSRAQRQQIKQNKKEENKNASYVVEERVEEGRMEGEGVEERQEEHHEGVNMLQDCAMNIGELSLYHREENSSIFNQIFL